jgi:hypothetical protein
MSSAPNRSEVSLPWSIPSTGSDTATTYKSTISEALESARRVDAAEAVATSVVAGVSLERVRAAETRKVRKSPAPSFPPGGVDSLTFGKADAVEPAATGNYAAACAQRVWAHRLLPSWFPVRPPPHYCHVVLCHYLCSLPMCGSGRPGSDPPSFEPPAPKAPLPDVPAGARLDRPVGVRVDATNNRAKQTFKFELPAEQGAPRVSPRLRCAAAVLDPGFVAGASSEHVAKERSKRVTQRPGGDSSLVLGA